MATTTKKYIRMAVDDYLVELRLVIKWVRDLDDFSIQTLISIMINQFEQSKVDLNRLIGLYRLYHDICEEEASITDANGKPVSRTRSIGNLPSKEHGEAVVVDIAFHKCPLPPCCHPR